MANVRFPGGKAPQAQPKGPGKAGTKAAKNLEAKKAANKASAAKLASAADDPDVDVDIDGPDAALLFAQMRKGKKQGVGNAEDMWKILADSEAEADSGAATAQGIKRKGRSGGSGMGENDGFDDDAQRREAYEAMLLGNISKDKEHFFQLTQLGSEDFFDPELDPEQIELLGLRAASHMVRMYDHWMIGGADRYETIDNAARVLAKFSSTQNVRRVLNELESAPIRDIYPLEVMYHMLENMPDTIEGMSEAPLVQNADQFRGGNHVFAGHAFKVHLPANMRIKAFALMGGDRPGYEFFPSPKEGVYSMTVDTPGTYEFALMGVPTKRVGRIIKEDSKKPIAERFVVEVRAMGRKATAPRVRGRLEPVAHSQHHVVDRALQMPGAHWIVGGFFDGGPGHEEVRLPGQICANIVLQKIPGQAEP
jgi:hypothetical protein